MSELLNIVILADPDAAELRSLALRLEELAPENEYLLFSSADSVMDFLNNSRADMLITRAGADGLEGFGLMADSQSTQPWLKTAMISDRSEDAVEAMRRRADGFILLPVSDDKLLTVLRNL